MFLQESEVYIRLYITLLWADKGKVDKPVVPAVPLVQVHPE